MIRMLKEQMKKNQFQLTGVTDMLTEGLQQKVLFLSNKLCGHIN